MTTDGRTMPAARGSAIQVELTSLANGPYAVGHVDGLAVLARGGAPGDTVLARVTRSHARHLEAVVESVLAPGPARRVAPCPFYPECGGCSWQHLDYPAQLAAKAANVERELHRLGVAPELSRRRFRRLPNGGTGGGSGCMSIARGDWGSCAPRAAARSRSTAA